METSTSLGDETDQRDHEEAEASYDEAQAIIAKLQSLTIKECAIRSKRASDAQQAGQSWPHHFIAKNPKEGFNCIFCGLLKSDYERHMAKYAG